MYVQMRLDEQALKLAILQSQLAQAFGLAGFHAAVFEKPLVKAGITKTVLATNFFDRHARFGLPQETNNLLLAVFACSHVHHSP